MVSFRGQAKVKPHPDLSPLRIEFKFADEVPRLFIWESRPSASLVRWFVCRFVPSTVSIFIRSTVNKEYILV